MPRSFSISASAILNATPAAVFAVVQDFARWNDWSPFFAEDPQVQFAIQGPNAGLGAVYTWNGKRSGKGRMEIVEVVPNERVVSKLEFFAPFKAVNETRWTIAATEQGATRFTWTMNGERPLFMALLGSLFGFDKRLKRTFEKGLAKLRGLVERR